ncbi:unnamed protein product [Peronospora farinosa]|uniref:Polyprotein n=1 Tax=Peronospora farinosa TaxID=134698 RepID=A0AAV0TC23_9STRA|nr:unnamed protein product [Peronospora farinosa]
MDDGVTMTQHLDKFDELIVGLQSLGEPIDEARQLVVLLSSLPAEYEIIASIVENAKDVTLIEVKEKLFKEYERQDKKEATERALKATTHGIKSKKPKVRQGRKEQWTQGQRLEESKRVKRQMLQLVADRQWCNGTHDAAPRRIVRLQKPSDKH